MEVGAGAARSPSQDPQMVYPYARKKAANERPAMNDELQKEIDAYLDAHWDDVVADIDALVRIESVEDLANAAEGAPFGPGPRAALDQALAIAERMGLETHDCDGYVGYADLPGASSKQIGIIGHVDVVPAGVGWNFEPYRVTRHEGYLMGRGVSDDKGPIMVALHAVKFWADRVAASGERLPYTVRVLFGANEETNMKDVPYYRARHDDPDFLFTPDNQFPLAYGESGICSGTLVSGEITDGMIVEIEGGQAVNAVPGLAHAVVRSSLEGLPEREGISLSPSGEGLVRVEARGVPAHASTPELGVNAIELLVGYLVDAGLCSAEERQFLSFLRAVLADVSGSRVEIAVRDEHFGALTMIGGMVSLQDGRICQSIDVRYPTTITAERIERRINKAAFESVLGAYFTLEHDKVPFLTDPESPAVRALLEAYNEATGENRQGATTKGGTYAREFSVGVSFGAEKPWVQDPAWVGGMHAVDEGVREEGLKEAFAIYARTLGNLMQTDL